MDISLRSGRVGHLAGRSLWRPTGFRVSDLGGGAYRFEDLNPEVRFTAVFSRLETLKLAMWLLRRVIWRHKHCAE